MYLPFDIFILFFFQIGNITFAQGDQTLTYDAIAALRTKIFSPEHGARDGVPRVCILLTDGQSTDKAKTLAEAEKAKEDGITIIGVGIGQVCNIITAMGVDIAL